MTEDKLINFPVVLLIAIVCVLFLAGFFSGLNAIDKKVAQKHSILVATPEEFTLGKTTFVRKPDAEIFLTSETKSPYMGIYVPKEEMSDKDAKLFDECLWKYHYCCRGMRQCSPLLVCFTSTQYDSFSERFYCRIKNDWFYFSRHNKTLIVINEVNYRQYKKEQDKIKNIELKEFWGK